jgi:hypothetical protein
MKKIYTKNVKKVIYSGKNIVLPLLMQLYQVSSLIQVSYNNCAAALVEEVKGIWTDFLISVLCDEWRKCKRGDFI